MFTDTVILHEVGWPEYSGAITSQQHESPSPVLWSVNLVYCNWGRISIIYYMIDCGVNINFCFINFCFISSPQQIFHVHV